MAQSWEWVHTGISWYSLLRSQSLMPAKPAHRWAGVRFSSLTFSPKQLGCASGHIWLPCFVYTAACLSHSQQNYLIPSHPMLLLTFLPHKLLPGDSEGFNCMPAVSCACELPRVEAKKGKFSAPWQVLLSSSCSLFTVSWAIPSRLILTPAMTFIFTVPMLHKPVFMEIHTFEMKWLCVCVLTYKHICVEIWQNGGEEPKEFLRQPL